MVKFSVVEICAGAGGQSLGLHKAGFAHSLAVELDAQAAETLGTNLGVPVVVGDVADRSVWDPKDYRGVDLFAGGVPCPPFSVAGQQLGSSDERDLFAWAIEQVEVLAPRAVMLENVRGLAGPRFAAYRQRIIDRLRDLGYVAEWKLLTSADFGVPQLRPRFILVAMKPEDQVFFHWPEPTVEERVTVGDSLFELMAANGWRHAAAWRELAQGVGPTIVGGSKKHGGADLGPTRAKAGWAQLFVNGKSLAEQAPGKDAPHPAEEMPRLTVEMVSRVQGWTGVDGWTFAGKKTAQYRQVGNAFPPPVAEAIGRQIVAAFRHEGARRTDVVEHTELQDPVYKALSQSRSGLTLNELVAEFNADGLARVQQYLAAIRKDFHLEEIVGEAEEVRYRLGEFRGFIGQENHARHEYLTAYPGRVS